MANDFECARCGYKESAHGLPPDDYPGVCNGYRRSRSEYRFDMAQQKARREAAAKQSTRPNDAIWIMTPYGPIDIGS